MASSYTAKDILVLEGLQPVRRRPGMYIGGVDAAGLHHLLWELVDNSVDEAMNGHADRITVTLHKDGASATVADNGRGIPVDRHAQYKKPALELILTTLHAGGKFEAKNYYHSGGLHGVGASVVTALAEKLVARVRRDGAEWEQTFSRGKPVGEAGRSPLAGEVFTIQKEQDGLHLDCALAWTEATEERVLSYVNSIPTISGGAHENGLRAGLAKAVRNYLTVHNLVPRGITITAEDVREGLVAVLAIKIPQPQFQGQTKERLNNAEVTPLIDGIVRSALENALNANRTTGDAIASRVVLAARARSASRAAAAEVQRKGAVSHRLNLPGKLADCSSTDPSECELFIVEGDSAGGSAKQGRDRAFQAILPLRGKVLNTEQASTAKVLTNKELSDIVSALGCGTGKDFDPAKLRYHKICLLMDADSDGNHICTLLLTFFYRHLPELIRQGYVYIAQPPLYRIEAGREVHWARDDAEKERLLAARNGNRDKTQVTRFKGLGEMNPSTLKETTLDPARRALLKVAIRDAARTEQTIQTLMGREVAPRFEFIMERAPKVEEVDV